VSASRNAINHLTGTAMKKILSLLCFAPFALGCSEQGATPDDASSDVGTAGTPEVATSQAALMDSASDNGATKYIAYVNGTQLINGVTHDIKCGGAFLSNRVVVTAKHCLKDVTNIRATCVMI